MADPIIEEFKRRAFISQLRGMSNPAGELNANLLEGATAGLGAMQKEDNDYAEQAINDRIAQNKALKNGS